MQDQPHLLWLVVGCFQELMLERVLQNMADRFVTPRDDDMLCTSFADRSKRCEDNDEMRGADDVSQHQKPCFASVCGIITSHVGIIRVRTARLYILTCGTSDSCSYEEALGVSRSEELLKNPTDGDVGADGIQGKSCTNGLLLLFVVFAT